MFEPANTAAESFKSASVQKINITMTAADLITQAVAFLKHVIGGAILDCISSSVALLTAITTIVDGASRLFLS